VKRQGELRLTVRMFGSEGYVASHCGIAMCVDF
jgi:hypothetical protein